MTKADIITEHARCSEENHQDRSPDPRDYRVSSVSVQSQENLHVCWSTWACEPAFSTISCMKCRYRSSISFSFSFFFWLRWVSLAARRLSLVAARGGYSLLQCAGFSLWWLLLLQSTASRHAGFSSCGVRAH